MSHALLATILILLDGRSGQWCTLEWIIERTAAPESIVLRHCVSLAESGQVRTRDVDCSPQFGVDVHDSSPVNDLDPPPTIEAAQACGFADY